jgi:hypothetical protein
MNADFWDNRYKEEEYVYGEEPNAFFKEHIDKLPPGEILLPAEGEGRNAVYAARKGWEAYAFDISFEGMKKATELARKYEVSLHYTNGGYADINYEPESMDVIAFIFAHVTPEVRTEYYHKLLKSLKPGGLVLLEGFHKDQIGKHSGGPKSIEMLYDEEELEKDFGMLKNVRIQRSDRDLDEGHYHSGFASLIQMTGYK